MRFNIESFLYSENNGLLDLEVVSMRRKALFTATEELAIPPLQEETNLPPQQHMC